MWGGRRRKKKVGGGFFSTPQNVPSQTEFEFYQTNRGFRRSSFQMNLKKETSQ
jgi:hypothetical protein